MTDSNLALRRPATQSSVSKWSKHQSLEQDAAGANNGRIDGRHGFHTDIEMRPWWQVDLQSICAIRQVKIHNRRDCADRLKRFVILASIDGQKWLPLHTKTSLSIFGSSDGEPYTADLPPLSFARYIRIQLEDKNYLHFCECEVFGKAAEPSTVDQFVAIFTAQMQEFEQSEKTRYDALSSGRQGHVAWMDNLRLFIEPQKYGPLLARYMSDGSYESRERTLVNSLLQQEDRVLEIGTAVGAVAMAAAKIVGPANVLTFDANPEIAADAVKNFAFNGLEAIQSRVAVLRNRWRYLSMPKAPVEFSISKEFWASRFEVGENKADIIKTVLVPTACLEDQIESHRATVLICDIEGGEVDLLIGSDLTGIRLLIMETHLFIGAKWIDAMMRWLINNGLNVDVHSTGNGIAVLRR